MIKTYLSLAFLVLATMSGALAQDISGHWKGKITQDDGGYRPEYILEMWLVQKGDSITGKSFVFVDNIYAEMNISGSLAGGFYLRLKDEHIVSHEVLQGMEWCFKTYQLLVKNKENNLTIEGTWDGKTSFSKCIPGKIYLKRIIPRA